MDMKMRREHTQMLRDVLALLLVFTGIFLAYTVYIQNRHYRQLVSLVGRSELSESGSGREIVRMLFSRSVSTEYETGLQIVKAAGYEKNSFPYLSGQAVSWGHMVFFLTVAFLAVLLFYKVKKRQMQRMHRELQQLGECLEDMADTTEKFELPDSSVGTFMMQEAAGRLAGRINAQIQSARLEKEHMSVFLENISHQLKTPLSGLVLYLEHLHHTERDNERRERLAACLKQSSLIQNIITTLLRFAQLDSGKIAISMKKENLSDIIQSCLAHVRPFSEEKEITVHADIQQECYIMCNRFWLGEAIENILKNAIEHTPCNGQLRLYLTQKNENWLLDIKDSGPGIRGEDLKHIFDRFYQSDPDYDRSGRVGIGLSLAKEIAERHGGILTAYNDAVEGAVFSFQLPLQYGTDKCNLTNS